MDTLRPLAASRISSDLIQHLSPSDALSSDHKAEEGPYRAILCWHHTTPSPCRNSRVSLDYSMAKGLEGGPSTPYHHTSFILPPKDPKDTSRNTYRPLEDPLRNLEDPLRNLEAILRNPNVQPKGLSSRSLRCTSSNSKSTQGVSTTSEYILYSNIYRYSMGVLSFTSGYPRSIYRSTYGLPPKGISSSPASSLIPELFGLLLGLSSFLYRPSVVGSSSRDRQPKTTSLLSEEQLEDGALREAEMSLEILQETLTGIAHTDVDLVFLESSYGHRVVASFSQNIVTGGAGRR